MAQNHYRLICHPLFAKLKLSSIALPLLQGFANGLEQTMLFAPWPGLNSVGHHAAKCVDKAAGCCVWQPQNLTVQVKQVHLQLP